MEGGAVSVPGGLLVAGGEESGAVQLLDMASERWFTLPLGLRRAQAGGSRVFLTS
jgi:hypothetical protein